MALSWADFYLKRASKAARWDAFGRNLARLVRAEIKRLQDPLINIKYFAERGEIFDDYHVTVAREIMNSLGPSISRSSCLNPRIFFQTCSKVDGLAARLAKQYTRPYSHSTSPIRWQEAGSPWKNTSNRISRKLSPSKLLTQFREFATKRVRILQRYEDLPKDYNPKVGLPFRETALTQDEAINIFGKGIEATGANRILRLLHGQRVSGTLEDPNALRNLTPFEEQLTIKGLKWLRDNVAVDEINNAGLRAEQEMREMEAEILEDSESIGLYKPISGPQNPNPYGKSGLEYIREAKEKAWEEKENQRKSQADEIRQNTGTLTTRSGSSVELRRPGEHPRLKYYLERSKVLPELPPEMSKFQRLWPGALVVLGTLVGCYVFAQVYTPPKTSARLFPDMPPSAATIIGIIMINTAVFVAWRVPALFRMLNKNFIIVPGYLFPTSMIGSVFSHQTLGHFAGNMAFLYFFGTRLHEEIGRGNFLAVYMVCGIMGSYASIIHFTLRSNFVSSTLGASGAIMGMTGCYLSMNGNEKVRLFSLFPPDDWPTLSSYGLLAILIAVDVLALWKRKESNNWIDHWAHLGGFAGGLVSAEMLKYKYRARRNREIERRKDMGIVDRIKEGRV